MQLRISLLFFSGILVGLVPYVYGIFNALARDASAQNPTELERSLGQILYSKLEGYRGNYSLEHVISILRDFKEGTRLPKEERELYAPLFEIAEKKAEREALLCLQRVEEYLEKIKENANVYPIVEDRIYVEILEEGSGATIDSEDTVTIRFKEYTMDGALLKDTGTMYTIPLSRTIKGFKFGLKGAKVGERRKIYIHPEFGFGKFGRSELNQLLIYEVTVFEKSL